MLHHAGYSKATSQTLMLVASIPLQLCVHFLSKIKAWKEQKKTKKNLLFFFLAFGDCISLS